MTERGMRRLASVCARAQQAGLHAGQTLTQARALCPTLAVADAEPEQDATALAALAHWATRHTPLAAAAPPDTLWLDITGCAHLAEGGEAGLAATLSGQLQRWGLEARWAIAGTTGAAYALAHRDPGRVVAMGMQAQALAGLPIEALRLAPADAAGLRQLGIRTIAALDRLPRVELVARFGQAARLRLDQALGTAAEPIAWPAPPPDWSETLRFAEPILTTESCAAALAQLAATLCARLAARRQGLRHAVAAFTRMDGTTHSIAVSTALPVHDAAWLLRLLGERLPGLDPGFGIEQLVLSAHGIDAVQAIQSDLAGGGAMQAQQRLAQLVDALGNRLRAGRLWRVAPRDSHLPEAAVQAIAPLAPTPRARTPCARTLGAKPAAHAPAWPDADTPRPIRLLRHPEPIDVIAALPDDPPVQFRWRGALHRVRGATGPERIAGEWWATDDASARDYYQVEDVAGARYWMFRADTRWFLHGLFG